MTLAHALILLALGALAIFAGSVLALVAFVLYAGAYVAAGVRG